MYGSCLTLLSAEDVVRLSSYVDYSTTTFGNSSDTCSICHEVMDYSMTTDCGHSFHYNCVAKWLQQNPTCPLCRSNKSIQLPELNSVERNEAA